MGEFLAPHFVFWEEIFRTRKFSKRLKFQWRNYLCSLAATPVRALDTRPKGPRFNAQLMHY